MIVAGICEFLGAVSLGSLVAKTIAGGIADPECFVGAEGLLMAGMLSALSAAAIWLILASLLGLPVSTTHSIVGAIVGMAIATKGAGCVKWGWGGMANIAISWVTSPILSGIVAFGIYWAVLRYIIHGQHPVENSFNALPFAFSFTSAVLLFLVSKSILTKYISTLVLILIVAAISILLGVAAKFRPLAETTAGTLHHCGTFQAIGTI
jgi:phosphate/sulfate permease